MNVWLPSQLCSHRPSVISLVPLNFTLSQLDFDGGAPPEEAWRRRLNSHANLLKEFSVTFMEAIRMVRHSCFSFASQASSAMDF